MDNEQRYHTLDMTKKEDVDICLATMSLYLDEWKYRHENLEKGIYTHFYACIVLALIPLLNNAVFKSSLHTTYPRLDLIFPPLAFIVYCISIKIQVSARSRVKNAYDTYKELSQKLADYDPSLKLTLDNKTPISSWQPWLMLGLLFLVCAAIILILGNPEVYSA